MWPQSVAQGLSLLVLHGVASDVECSQLRNNASSVAASKRGAKGHTFNVFEGSLPDLHAATPIVVGGGFGYGRLQGQSCRMPVVDMLDHEGTDLCDAVLMRALRTVDEGLPSLLSMLFVGAASVAAGLASAPSCIHNEDIAFAPGEPAINVYTEHGFFTPHEDRQCLTILLALSSDTEHFSAGGTGFWSLEARGESNVMGQHSRAHTTPPTLVMTPPPGSALVFGGDVTHSGLPISAGERVVCVASFSARSGTREHAVFFIYYARFNGLTLLAYLNYTPRTPCRSTESRFPSPDPVQTTAGNSKRRVCPKPHLRPNGLAGA